MRLTDNPKRSYQRSVYLFYVEFGALQRQFHFETKIYGLLTYSLVDSFQPQLPLPLPLFSPLPPTRPVQEPGPRVRVLEKRNNLHTVTLHPPTEVLVFWHKVLHNSGTCRSNQTIQKADTYVVLLSLF